MQYINSLFLIIILLCFTQCASNKILLTEYKGSDGIITEANGNLESYKFDRYNLNDMKVDGDSLVINLSYSGGCRDHEFNLIIKKYVELAKPFEVNLVLSHNSNFDPCEQYITENHFFNLIPLKNKFMKMYGTEKETIRLKLDDKKVIYYF